MLLYGLESTFLRVFAIAIPDESIGTTFSEAISAGHRVKA